MKRPFAHILLLCTLFGLSNSCAKRPPDPPQHRVAVEDSLAQALARAFNAREFTWADSVSLLFGRVYSIDLATALEDQAQPWLFRVELADVRVSGQDTLAIFEPQLIDLGDYYLVLRASSDLFPSLIEVPRDRYLTTVGVIARIESVSRPMFVAHESADDAATPSPDPTLVTRGYFVLRGELIGLQVLSTVQ